MACCKQLDQMLMAGRWAPIAQSREDLDMLMPFVMLPSSIHSRTDSNAYVYGQHVGRGLHSSQMAVLIMSYGQRWAEVPNDWKLSIVSGEQNSSRMLQMWILKRSYRHKQQFEVVEARIRASSQPK